MGSFMDMIRKTREGQRLVVTRERALEKLADTIMLEDIETFRGDIAKGGGQMVAGDKLVLMNLVEALEVWTERQAISIEGGAEALIRDIIFGSNTDSQYPRAVSRPDVNDAPEHSSDIAAELGGTAEAVPPTISKEGSRPPPVTADKKFDEEIIANVIKSLS